MSFRIHDNVTDIFSTIIDKYLALETLSNRRCNCKPLLQDPGKINVVGQAVKALAEV